MKYVRKLQLTECLTHNPCILDRNRNCVRKERKTNILHIKRKLNKTILNINVTVKKSLTIQWKPRFKYTPYKLPTPVLTLLSVYIVPKAKLVTCNGHNSCLSASFIHEIGC